MKARATSSHLEWWRSRKVYEDFMNGGFLFGAVVGFLLHVVSRGRKEPLSDESDTSPEAEP